MIFLKFKQIMPFDKADIQFVINNSSSELKVHSKSNALKLPLLYKKHVLEILYLNIKILTGIISWIIL